jgi:hypothetical protein
LSDKNDRLYEESLKALQELFSDKSVSKEKCRENLRGLID